MAATRIAAISRAEAFSPNRVGDDAAIFNAVCRHLCNRGYDVVTYSEELFLQSGDSPEIVIGMYRQQPTLRYLRKLEDSGAIVINSAYGVENCTRERMTRILLDSGAPYPDSLIIDTDSTAGKALEKAAFSSCWIKRADGHNQHKDDVSFCCNIAEAKLLIQQYSERGIQQVVVNRHIDGDWIKFYGVAGTPFFYWYFPEKSSGYQMSHQKDLDTRLREISEKAAREIGITVYGGDCILNAEGNPVLIDFNDWPSFAPCRDEASGCIADSILETIKHK